MHVDFNITRCNILVTTLPAPPHMLENPLRANLVKLSDDCPAILKVWYRCQPVSKQGSVEMIVKTTGTHLQFKTTTKCSDWVVVISLSIWNISKLQFFRDFCPVNMAWSPIGKVKISILLPFLPAQSPWSRENTKNLIQFKDRFS